MTKGRRNVKTAFVYIMGSASGTLHVGVTSNLERRVWEHKHHVNDGFTKRYNGTKLLCMEECSQIDDAIAREKQIKGWGRMKKVALIEVKNSKWWDLSRDWEI